ncbi:MAG: hypothetical protein U0W24_24365 [Bacteroidales bacterium]
MRSVLILTLTIGLFLCVGCSPKSRYDRIVKRELASGVRHDSLFLGISLGMTEKEFYTHCWKLNRQGLIKQGNSNATVEFIVEKELKSRATMNFYPYFVDTKIVLMPVQFTYTGWAPWNKELSSDKLLEDVLQWYKKVYGDDFMKVTDKKEGIAYVKVDGNRRISVFKKDDMSVLAVFTDLLAVKNESPIPSDTLGIKNDSLNFTGEK